MLADTVLALLTMDSEGESKDCTTSTTTPLWPPADIGRLMELGLGLSVRASWVACPVSRVWVRRRRSSSVGEKLKDLRRLCPRALPDGAELRPSSPREEEGP